ncbi:Scr1 family TA system antitoxin-like transcriptional regulator [Nocardia sp. BMG51109]|uniref:Scr1 family TA system antitoxin-like transcriptional regulator n=1 Tax=Nocardia sp. BMG51109 TaxID=1056816 RepID=UPI000688143B|nr:Scr1 family TA system antitoxin-like transcriptional regulator [Nocardia sp. BMG51109]
MARWELSYRTRKRRDELNVTGPKIAAALGFSTTYWPKVERDLRILKEDNTTRLLEFLEFSPEEREDLMEVRRLAGQSGWWSEYSGLFSEQQLRIFGLEWGAEEISTVESLLIPGLLQTEEYARTLITGDTAFIRQIEVQQRIDARLERQKRLTDDDPLRLNVVVSEAALRQQTGGPDVLRRQLQHLISMIEAHDTIDFRVLPFASHTGAIRGVSTFHLLDFPRPHLPTLAWNEVPTHDELVEDEQRIRNMTIVFGHLQTESLSREDSLDLLNGLV